MIYISHHEMILELTTLKENYTWPVLTVRSTTAPDPTLFCCILRAFITILISNNLNLLQLSNPQQE